MVQNGQIVRALIVSASDAEQETALIREVISDWNRINSFVQATVVEPVAFEQFTELLPEDACDLMIGAFWTKLPMEHSKRTSVDAIDQFITAGKPTLLYASTRAPDWKSVNRDEHAQLVEFRKAIGALGLLTEFSSQAQLRSSLSKRLTAAVSEILSSIEANPTSPTQAAAPVQAFNQREEFRQSSLKDFGKFVHQLSVVWRSEREASPISTINARRILVTAAQQVKKLPMQYLDATTRDSLVQIAQGLDEAGNQVLGVGRQANLGFWERGDVLMNEIVDCCEKAHLGSP